MQTLENDNMETRIKKNEMKVEETKTVLGRRNCMILTVGSILIIAGYVLMGGEGSTLTAYQPDIFSRVRINVAPIVCLSGYLLNIIGILYRQSRK